jgi:hypothetical protein
LSDSFSIIKTRYNTGGSIFIERPHHLLQLLKRTGRSVQAEHLHRLILVDKLSLKTYSAVGHLLSRGIDDLLAEVATALLQQVPTEAESAISQQLLPLALVSGSFVGETDGSALEDGLDGLSALVALLFDIRGGALAAVEGVSRVLFYLALIEAWLLRKFPLERLTPLSPKSEKKVMFLLDLIGLGWRSSKATSGVLKKLWV